MDLKYSIYRFFWKFPWLYGKPIHLDLEINNTCNEKCLSCWHSLDTVPFKLKKMDFGTAQNILKMGRRAGCLSVKFNLRGEPGLYTRLPDLIKFAKSIGYVDTMINTNAAYPVDRMMEIVRAGIDTVIVSVDSLNLETYKKVHGATNEQYVMMYNNLEYLNSCYRVNPLRVVINWHINKTNEFEDVKFAKSLFSNFKFNVKNTIPRKGTDISTVRIEHQKWAGCSHAKRRLTVQVDGSVYPCCLCYDSPADIRLGSLYDKGSNLIKLWLGKKRKTILMQTVKNLLPSCQNCMSAEVWRGK